METMKAETREADVATILAMLDQMPDETVNGIKLVLAVRLEAGPGGIEDALEMLEEQSEKLECIKDINSVLSEYDLPFLRGFHIFISQARQGKTVEEVAA